MSTTQFLSTPQGRIAYDVTGEGPLVVLVPGMGDLRSTYRFLAPAISSAGFTAVTVDLRGHGESDATFTSYGDVETASDITALIESLGKPAVIVGNSMAAGAAAYVAATHPELVTGLVLVGPFVRDPKTSAFQRLMFRIAMATPWAAASWKSYLPNLYAGRKPADFDEHRTAIVNSIRRPGYAAAFSATTRTTHAAVEARLNDVMAPTLVVMGALDPDFADPAAEAEWIANTLKGTVVMVPDAGHYPHAQQPDVVNPAVLDFIAKANANA